MADASGRKHSAGIRHARRVLAQQLNHAHAGRPTSRPGECTSGEPDAGGPVRRWCSRRCVAAAPSRSSPTGPNPRSTRPGRLRATTAWRSRAAQARCSSASPPGCSTRSSSTSSRSPSEPGATARERLRWQVRARQSGRLTGGHAHRVQRRRLTPAQTFWPRAPVPPLRRTASAKRGQSRTRFRCINLPRRCATLAELGRERRSSARNESSRGMLIGSRNAERVVSRWL
jgi:hypothetical protein